VLILTVHYRRLLPAVLLVAVVGGGVVIAVGAPNSSSSPVWRVPDVPTQRALVAQLDAVAGTVTADQEAWARCGATLASRTAHLAACQAQAYVPTARAMSQLGGRFGKIGAMVPGTHCARAATAAAAGMPASAAEWRSGQPGRPGGAVTPEGNALTLAYDACTARPVWTLTGFPGALYGP
jgi:hypothetical protein